MNKTIPAIFFIVCVLFTLAGCESKKPEIKSVPAAGETPFLPGMEETLAKIGADKITRYDVEQTAIRMLGVEQTALLDDKAYEKILESIVLSRVISKARLREITSEELAHIEWKVKEYREQLLVNQYLKTHAKSEPVSHEMIKQYYDEHPEKFGGKAYREYEMISSTQKLQGDERQRLLNALKDADFEKDWNNFTRKLSKQNLSVEYRKGNADEQLLKPELRNTLSQLIVGETSKPIYMQGNVYIVRVTHEQKREPRPLPEVSAEIRKSLAPMQVKKAIRDVSGDLLKATQVEYLKQGN